MTVRLVQSSTVLSSPIYGTSGDTFTIAYRDLTLTYDDPREVQDIVDKMLAGIEHLRRRDAAGPPLFSQPVAEPLVGATAAGDL